MVKHYDVAVFGTGSAMNIVSALLERGYRGRIAVIENSMVGGICLTRGCIPSKMLIEVARNVRRIREAERLGIRATIESVDFTGVMERVWRRIYSESKEIEHSLKRHPLIDLYQVNGTFVGDYTVDVGGREIEGDKVLLCTGSRPAIPRVPGIDEVDYYTNDNFFRDLRELPRRTVVVGGGFVGLELGFFLAMMGSQVTILQRRSRILPEEEPEISERLQEDLSRYMDIRTNHEVVEFRRSGERKIVVAENKLIGDNVEFEADAILIASGRASNSDITRPEKTGVKTDKKGWIVVDEHLRTKLPHIYAIGDVIRGPMLAHKASEEGIAAVEHMAKGFGHVDYQAIPSVVYTHPEVAGVGYTEEELKEKGIPYKVGRFPYAASGRARAMGDTEGFIKVLAHAKTDRILGVHGIGARVGDVLAEAALAIFFKASAEDVGRAPHHHPSLSEILKEAALAAWEKPIHL